MVPVREYKQGCGSSAKPFSCRSASGHSARFLALATAFFVLCAAPLHAVNCTTQASLPPADREALLAAANPIANAIAEQEPAYLQSNLLPAVAGDWESIRSVAQAAIPLFKGGRVYWGDGYLLDATDLKAPTDTEFFCTNADSNVTMTITLRSLPAGRYALLIGDYEGAPLAGQVALILGVDTTNGNKWKLGGLFVREGALDGHDGLWFWRHARELAQQKSAGAEWSAWFSYDLARWLLLPVDFLSSPHLEKLNKEQTMLGPNPSDSLPLTVTGAGADAGKSWRVTALRIDASLHDSDLGLEYEGSGVTDPIPARAEAIAVMSALLKLHPELRSNFHGLWAYAEKDGRRNFAIELAMHDIP
jgi:hypothetical protein